MFDILLVTALGWGFVAVMVAMLGFGFLVPSDHSTADDKWSEHDRN
jgi:hypothetical protein